MEQTVFRTTHFVWQKSKGSLAIRHGWRVEGKYSSCPFLTSALDGGEWSASRPGRDFYPGTHWRGGRVGHRPGLHAEDGEKLHRPCRESKPGCPIRCQAHYTEWATPAPILGDMTQKSN
jgi:hypothetical protein